jgi:transcriptional regulator with XRE-family HTH domain
VRTGRAALAEYVLKEIAERSWSYSEVVRRSGGHIKSANTLTNLVNGNVQTVSEETVHGLSVAFNVLPDVVFNIYRRKSPTEPDVEEQQLLSYFRSLPRERKADALSHLEMLHNRYGKNGQQGEAGSKGPESGAVYEGVAGIPKSVRGGSKKAVSKSSKKSDK